jgi:hypothetical protein
MSGDLAKQKICNLKFDKIPNIKDLTLKIIVEIINEIKTIKIISKAGGIGLKVKADDHLTI